MYIKNPNGSGPIVGLLFPGNVIFPDFTNPQTTDYWLMQFQEFHDLVTFDTVLLDMNEISSFCQGFCFNHTSNSSLFNPDAPPFVPTTVPIDSGSNNHLLIEKEPSV